MHYLSLISTPFIIPTMCEWMNGQAKSRCEWLLFSNAEKILLHKNNLHHSINHLYDDIKQTMWCHLTLFDKNGIVVWFPGSLTNTTREAYAKHGQGTRLKRICGKCNEYVHWNSFECLHFFNNKSLWDNPNNYFISWLSPLSFFMRDFWDSVKEVV